MKAVDVRVNGSVQGVFYRSFVRTRAQLLNLKGWVKNTMDGCVEIVFDHCRRVCDQRAVCAG